MNKRISVCIAFLLITILSAINLDARKRPSRAAFAGARARITNTYFSHNAYHNGSKGFYLYYNLTVDGMEGHQIKAVATLYRSNGKPIHYVSGKSTAINWYGNPAYYSTTYNNNWFFFPYNFNVPYGENSCYAVIRVYAPNGKLLGATPRITFTYTRR